jgi:hypothetical protein
LVRSIEPEVPPFCIVTLFPLRGEPVEFRTCTVMLLPLAVVAPTCTAPQLVAPGTQVKLMAGDVMVPVVTIGYLIMTIPVPPAPPL